MRGEIDLTEKCEMQETRIDPGGDSLKMGIL